MSVRQRRYLILVVIYSIGLFFGVREYLLSRSLGSVSWPSEEWSEMTKVVSQIAPDEADTKWLLSKESLLEGDPEEFAARLEEALALGVKDNEFLLHDYAQLMLDRRANYRVANEAANRWRTNFPMSRETLGVELGTGPQTPAEEAALGQALSEVPWLADFRLESSADADGNERRVVQLAFRPATPIDLREAIAAMTVLSLTEEQRARFRVRCSTLEECTLEPRR